MSVYLLLPAYNEEAALGELLPRVFSTEIPLHVIVVDDGSTDKTAEVAESFSRSHHRMRLIRHGANRGLGAALRTLLRAALEEAEAGDAVVTMDADNTMDPALIPQMVESLEQGYDLVIASRFAGGEERGVPLLRRLYSRGARWLTQMALGVRDVRDYTCGYRAYRADLLYRLADAKPELFDSDGFSATFELLLNLSQLEPRIAEVPLRLRYDLKVGPSKMNVPRTIWEYLRLLWHLRRIGPSR